MKMNFYRDMVLGYTTGALVALYIVQCAGLPLAGLTHSDNIGLQLLDTPIDVLQNAIKNKHHGTTIDENQSKPEIDQTDPINSDRYRSRRHDPHADHANHTMQHILDQVHKGHVTTESMNHWMNQLQELYDHDEIDSDDLRAFIDQMHASLADTEFADACCPFGK